MFVSKSKTSTWEPKSNHHTVNTFCDSFLKEIESLEDKKPKPRKNLTKEEKAAMTKLRNRKDLIFTRADKGGALVIQLVSDYIAEAERQLQDTTSYKQLHFDPTTIHEARVCHKLSELMQKKLISERLVKKLSPKSTKSPKLYLLPKLHKPNIPGRPVISSINSPTTIISEYVDHCLQPYVVGLKSFIKDTTDFINKIENSGTHSNCILVTMDIKSLYTNIPHSEGIEAIANTMQQNPHITKDFDIKPEVITSLLELILKLNNFTFNDKFYLQTMGCAMGTKCAPAYANLLMREFEEKLLLPIIEHLSKMYLRFIDDIFILWSGSEDELKEFITLINSLHPSIKFEVKYSHTEINYLDCTVFFDKDKLKTRLFVKPTDQPMLLHDSSYHPNSLKHSIPYSQALRKNRICSNQNDVEKHLQVMQTKFLERGYDQGMLNWIKQ